MARAGKRVMQFISEGRYVANVVDGKTARVARKSRDAVGHRQQRFSIGRREVLDDGVQHFRVVERLYIDIDSEGA